MVESITARSSGSEQVDALSPLGNAAVELTVEDLPPGAVAKVIEPLEDASKGLPVVLAEQSLDVLKQEELRLLRFDESEERFEDRAASGVFESPPPSCLAVWLTGESANEQVEVGEMARINVEDVAIIRVLRKMPIVNLECRPVDLAVADASPIGGSLLYRKLEAADAGKRAEVAQGR